jgi:hypothetical protein
MSEEQAMTGEPEVEWEYRVVDRYGLVRRLHPDYVPTERDMLAMRRRGDRLQRRRPPVAPQPWEDVS